MNGAPTECRKPALTFRSAAELCRPVQPRILGAFSPGNSNRYFLVGLETSVTPTNYTSELRSNRHFWEGSRRSSRRLLPIKN
jgi:hypothetical protein